jgi:rubrerythrin
MTTKAKLTGKPAVEVVMAGLPKERTMTETKPCETGKHCERQARDLGACVAGMCFPPAPVGGVADYGFRCYSCGKEWEGTAPTADCPNCGTTNEHCAANPRGEGGTDGR